MSRDLRLFLEDIQRSCQKILRYIEGMDFARFFQDERTVDAVIRNLIVIGEAVKQIPVDVRQRYPDIEWHKVAGLRDIVVHRYFGIDEELLWDILQTHIPRLLQYVDMILQREFPD